jgi:hypothetical protein
VPLADGVEVSDPPLLGVTLDGEALPVALRGLARWPSGAWRSVQIQVDVDVDAVSELVVESGQTPAESLTFVPVVDTLVVPDGTSGPRVWVRLAPGYLASTDVFGPLDEANVGDPTGDPWSASCDYSAYDVEAFLAVDDTAGSWLYDRPTALYRGYARVGDLGSLESAYRETAIYAAGMSGSGSDVQIPVPGATGDLKYHYAQGLAMHYLLTGDDRFRERAEDVADRVATLWPSPGYAGGADFWTERHAGFALLAYVWAEIVSDDRSASYAALADDAMAAYAQVQATDPTGGSAPPLTERCFIHSADAHGEPFGTWGCSPWMSAILADGIDAWARERGEDGTATAAPMLVALGRSIANHGLDAGKPTYWMAFGAASEVDDFDEHWGESAYVLALAAYWSAVLDGTAASDLVTTRDALIAGMASNGEVGQLRSFNWQCRSAVMTPRLVASTPE